MKNKKSKIKQTETAKQIGTMCCFGCKDFTHNFKPQEVKMTNKVLRKKSKCIVFLSKKTRFLKQGKK